MPADYTNLPAHIATRVAVAASRYLFAPSPQHRNELAEALREAREAERVTVEAVARPIMAAHGYTGSDIDFYFSAEREGNDIRSMAEGLAKAALRAAGYTVGEYPR